MFGRYSRIYAGSQRLGRIRQGAADRWVEPVPAVAAPALATAAPYLKVVRGSAFSYDFAPHVSGETVWALAPGSAALPAGLSLSGAGVLSGTASVSGMHQAPTLRASNTAGHVDLVLDISVAQRPAALAAPVLTEINPTLLRVTKPTVSANEPPVDFVDVLFGPATPPTTLNATLVADAFPDPATTLDLADQTPGASVYVTTRPRVAWGDGTFLAPSPEFGPNVASHAMSTPYVNQAPVGANKALDFLIPAPDTTAPTLTVSSPADEATGVALAAAVTLTFSEPVVLAATGTVTIRENAGGGFADWEVFDLATDIGSGAGKIAASGTDVILTPTAAMVAGRTYAIRVLAGAILDNAGNAFAAIADDTTLNWATVASGPVFFTNGNAYFTDKTATTLSGNNGQWVTRHKVRLADAGSGILYQFAGSQGTFEIRPSGSLRITMQDSGSNVRLNAVASAAGKVTTGVWHDIVTCADLVAGTFKVWINGVLEMNLTMAAFAPTTFQTTRDIFLLASSSGLTPVTGDVEIMEFFKNQITTDGVVSGLTPYKTIQGNAAAVMADSWYQGGTAT